VTRTLPSLVVVRLADQQAGDRASERAQERAEDGALTRALPASTDRPETGADGGASHGASRAADEGRPHGIGALSNEGATRRASAGQAGSERARETCPKSLPIHHGQFSGEPNEQHIDRFAVAA
jgi:hypothetical protein